MKVWKIHEVSIIVVVTTVTVTPLQNNMLRGRRKNTSLTRHIENSVVFLNMANLDHPMVPIVWFYVIKLKVDMLEISRGLPQISKRTKHTCDLVFVLSATSTEGTSVLC